jgi:hypothetical protein
MSDDESIQRSRLATRVYRRYGPERVHANEELIASAAHAITRIERLIPAATVQLDIDDRGDDAERN